MPSPISRSADRRLLVVDLDDTLIRSRTNRASLLVDTLVGYGVAVDHERLGELWGRPFREVVVGLAPEVSSRFDDFVATYCEVLEATPPETCPGVGAEAWQLAATFRCVVHTASHSRVAAADLRSAAIDQHFEQVVGSDRQTCPKPDSRSGLELMNAIDRASTGPPGCYIGDSLTDMAIAATAGLQMVAVNYGAASQEQWLEAGLDGRFVAHSFADAVSISLGLE